MMADDQFPSSEDDTLDCLPRRWISKGVMPTCPLAGSFKSLKTEEISLKIEEIRRRFNILSSVVISMHTGLQHPAENDEVVASFYQLEYGLPMPIDAEMCEILTGWGIPLQQLNPSIIISIRRLLTIARVFCRRLLPSDVHRIISPTPRDWGEGAGICFICTWVDSERRINDFPDSYKHWESPCFKFRNWQNGHQLGVPYKLASSSLIQPRKSGRVTRVPPDFESDERIRRLFDLPGDLFNVSYPDSIVRLIHFRENTLGHISAVIPAVPVAQYPATPSLVPSAEKPSNSKEHHSSLSSSYGFPRIPRKRYRPVEGRNEAQTSIPRTNDERGLKRLRKTHQDYHPRCVNIDAGLLNRNVTQIPDAMSEKVCKVVRRCDRFLHKNYNFIEESVCASSGGFVPGHAGNRESTNSGSSNDDPGFENASSEDISSGGPPSPVPNLYAAHVPLGRETVRENDFSNTVIIDHSLPSDDNISVSRNDFPSPGQREPTSNNGEKITQPPLPTQSMLDCDIFSVRGMMGSGSTDPCPENENVRVCRPASFPQSDPGSRPSLVSPSLVQPINELGYDILLKNMTENYNQFLKYATQLNDGYKQRTSETGADARMRQEITRLERINAELSAAMRMLIEQLAGVRQKLADSKSRELQLQLFLEEIGGVLPDSWEH